MLSLYRRPLNSDRRGLSRFQPGHPLAAYGQTVDLKPNIEAPSRVPRPFVGDYRPDLDPVTWLRLGRIEPDLLYN